MDLYYIPNIRPKQSPIPNTAVTIVLCRPENQCSLTSVGIQIMNGVAMPSITNNYFIKKYINILHLSYSNAYYQLMLVPPRPRRILHH